MTSSLPLSSHQLFHTREVDEARELVARVFCPHGLAPSGRARQLDARHHSARLGPDASLNYVQYGPGVNIDPGHLQHFYLLQIPWRGRAQVQCGAQVVHSDATMASLPSPTEALSMRWEDDSPHRIVLMSRQAMERQWEQLSQTSLKHPLVFNPGVDWRRPELQPVLDFINYLYRVLAQADGLAHPLLGQQAQQYLMSNLLLLQAHNHQTHAKESGARKDLLPKSVRRAREFLHQHADRAIALADVCDHVGVSARTLQLAFREHFGQSPMAYLRDVRLDQVHRHLQSADKACTSVTKVAMDWGFMHMGHFAASYQRRFHERPHETLKAGMSDDRGL
jgi:AraC-like DNA-binding protein